MAASGLLPLDLLFIENVGNLVCPASYALGEDFKVALLSVAEGDDKPFKYPALFARAPITLITKVDLLGHVPFDLDRAVREVETLNPEACVIPVSSTTGEGMTTWYERLEDEIVGKRTAPTTA